MRAVIAAGLALLLLPVAAAQQGSLGEIRSWVEPEEMTLDEPFIFVDGEAQRNEYSFTVFIEGSISCAPAAGPPLSIPVSARGTTATEAKEGDDTITYFRIAPQEFEVAWEQASTGLNDYTASAAVEIAITNEGQPPTDLTAEIGWVGSLFEQQGSTNCNPNGYGWNIEATNHTIIIPGPGEVDDDFDFGDDENGTPAPLGLGAIALAGAAFARRRR